MIGKTNAQTGGGSAKKSYQSKTFEGLMGYTVLHRRDLIAPTQTITITGTSTIYVDGVTKTSPVTIKGTIQSLYFEPTSASSTSVKCHILTAQKRITDQSINSSMDTNNTITGGTIQFTLSDASVINGDADGIYAVTKAITKLAVSTNY